MLKFGASLTDDTSSINYDCKMFIIHATEQQMWNLKKPWGTNVKAGKPYSRGNLCAVDLLVLTSLGQLLFKLKILLPVLQNKLP